MTYNVRCGLMFCFLPFNKDIGEKILCICLSTTWFYSYYTLYTSLFNVSSIRNAFGKKLVPHRHWNHGKGLELLEHD